MVKVGINLHTVEKIRDFVNLTGKYPFEMDLGNGRYVIDAKSMMGIFSLDLSKEAELTINAEEYECQDFLEKLNVITPYRRIV